MQEQIDGNNFTSWEVRYLPESIEMLNKSMDDQ